MSGGKKHPQRCAHLITHWESLHCSKIFMGAEGEAAAVDGCLVTVRKMCGSSRGEKRIKNVAERRSQIPLCFPGNVAAEAQRF